MNHHYYIGTGQRNEAEKWYLGAESTEHIHKNTWKFLLHQSCKTCRRTSWPAWCSTLGRSTFDTTMTRFCSPPSGQARTCCQQQRAASSVPSGVRHRWPLLHACKKFGKLWIWGTAEAKLVLVSLHVSKTNFQRKGKKTLPATRASSVKERRFRGRFEPFLHLLP